MRDISALWLDLQQVFIHYGIQIIAAAIILLIGMLVAKLIRSILDKILQRRKIDTTIRVFLTRLVYAGILIFIFIATLAKLGVDTTSIIAILGAASLAVGLALKNSLSDFAAGILLIALRPFRVGDTVDATAQGTVVDVNFLYTRIKTVDGKSVLIPNGQLMSSNITNYSTYKTRRNEIIISISYSDDLEHGKAILHSAVSQEAKVLSDPAPVVAIQKLDQNCINLLVRYWTNAADMDSSVWALNESIQLKLSQAGFKLPANPQ